MSCIWSVDTLYLSYLSEFLMHTIYDKKLLYETRNKVTNIPANYRNSYEDILCITGCQNNENMTHIYECNILNQGEINTLSYDWIYGNDLKKCISVFKIMERNLQRRKEYQTKH